jgi:hypothetical protein
MTRAALCGAALAACAGILGLEVVEEHPEIVLVDLDDVDAIARAAAIPAEVPRIAVGGPERELLLRALGSGIAFSRSADAASIGPLIAIATPARPRGRTRLVVVTGPRGGVGRTLLATGIAARLAARSSVIVLDVTGSGAAGWWLRLVPGPWSDLESLADELTAEHLGIVAAERDRLRLVGGTSAMPSVGLVMAAAHAATAIAEIVIVDAPSLFDERTRALGSIADRVLLVASEDPTSLAAIEVSIDEQRTWLIASRCRAGSLAGRSVMRELPDDPGSVRSAGRGPSAVGGALGRAYDELAELLAIDVA